MNCGLESPLKAGLILSVVLIPQCQVASEMRCIVIRGTLAARRPWAAGFVLDYEYARPFED